MSAAVVSHISSHSTPLAVRESDQPQISSSPRSYPHLVPFRGSESFNSSMSSASSSRLAAKSATRSPTHDERTTKHAEPGSSPQVSQGRQSPPNIHGSQSKHDPSNSLSSSHVPIIKEERPLSPEALLSTPTPGSRHRPRRLDLSNTMSAAHATQSGRPYAPLTSKDSGGLSAMQELGLACLSPGIRFQGQDPSTQSELARSMDVREQQRQIIESRLHKGSTKDATGEGRGPSEIGPQSSAFARAPGTSRRKGPPPGLSIHAPSPHHFASEPRVIQSAPLHHSFTGLKPGTHPHPLSRQILNHHSHQHSLSSTTGPSAQQIIHVPATQTSNRLPPIQDVLASENLGSASRPSATLSRGNSGPGPFYPIGTSADSRDHSSQSGGHQAPVPSPGFLPPPISAGLHAYTYPPLQTSHNDTGLSSLARPREREFKSAEEAVQSLSGGREELLPKIVHYGGHQPPTPPSPLPPVNPGYQSQNSSRQGQPSFVMRPDSGRRRTRDEYERDFDEKERMDVDSGMERDSHRIWSGQERGRERYRDYDGERMAYRPGPFGEGKDSPEVNRRKKEEFIGLCARAWDLFHS